MAGLSSVCFLSDVVMFFLLFVAILVLIHGEVGKAEMELEREEIILYSWFMVFGPPTWLGLAP